ncbi:MAG: hypothetical protein PHV02_18120 [Rhodocyclaceae bacterium]|nr:hypothetical protein [Rhodocyclaceae bacterium]
MKTTLKTALTATLTQARRLGLLFQIRSLEIMIDGQNKALEVVTCPITAFKITLARSNAKRELAITRAEYTATFPAGVRRTWTMA